MLRLLNHFIIRLWLSTSVGQERRRVPPSSDHVHSRCHGRRLETRQETSTWGGNRGGWWLMGPVLVSMEMSPRANRRGAAGGLEKQLLRRNPVWQLGPAFYSHTLLPNNKASPVSERMKSSQRPLTMKLCKQSTGLPEARREKNPH